MEEITQKLFIVRHGERVDLTFDTWISECFDSSGNYTPTDLNMPTTLPQRPFGSKDYVDDTPLTQMGVHQAFLTGKALKAANANFNHVYCSPSFRCVQTADAILRGMGKKENLSIQLEPGLFEWLGWYKKAIPNWFTTEELIKEGFNIDTSYLPFISKDKLVPNNETWEQFYKRNFFVTQNVLSENIDNDILFVGHSVTLDTCSRELVGKVSRSYKEIAGLLEYIPYCSLVVVNKKGEQWKMGEPPCHPISQSNNKKFDWKVLQ